VTTDLKEGTSQQRIYSAQVGALEAGTQYEYAVACAGADAGACGDGAQWFNYTTDLPGRVVTFAVFGDMGVDNDQSIGLLTQGAASGLYDAVLHFGDVAYDLHEEDGKRGDDYQALLQPVAANLPYHICPGNHEATDDFKQYRARWGKSMPNAGPGGIYHSFDVGLVHVVMFSSEVWFYFSEYGLGQLMEQHRWLHADLAAVNRTKTPWVVTMAHRPTMCSANDDDDDCHHAASLVRSGVGGVEGFEKLLKEYSVDVHLAGHEHSYERFWPAYDRKATQQNYVDPAATVHVITHMSAS
jgi:hypothetical protein